MGHDRVFIGVSLAFALQNRHVTNIQVFLGLSNPVQGLNIMQNG